VRELGSTRTSAHVDARFGRQQGHTVTAMPNLEQMDYWAGSGGEHWVAEQVRYDEINAEFGARLVAALAPQPGERVLDVGCGNGALSLAIAPLVAPTGLVLGLDISGPMLAVAAQRARAARVSNAIFEHGDAQTYRPEAASFDALVSRFGVMFFDDPDAAFANLARSLRPGGRTVFTCWQNVLANEWLMVPVGAALAHVPMPELGEAGRPGPFSLAEPDRIRSILAGAGFTDVNVDDVRCPMRMGSTVEDTVSFMQSTDMADTLMADVSDAAAAVAWAAVREALRPYAGPYGVVLQGAAWLVTGTRRS
jgi:SAM-dependent methyltransferase